MTHEEALRLTDVASIGWVVAAFLAGFIAGYSAGKSE
jgi:hypothetical protein